MTSGNSTACSSTAHVQSPQSWSNQYRSLHKGDLHIQISVCATRFVASRADFDRPLRPIFFADSLVAHLPSYHILMFSFGFSCHIYIWCLHPPPLFASSLNTHLWPSRRIQVPVHWVCNLTYIYDL